MPQSPEAAFEGAVAYAARKRLGQFFTPLDVARAMTRWACANRPRSFLDPAVGPGVFLEAFAEIRDGRAGSVTAIDIDGHALRLAEERARRLGLKADLICADFLETRHSARFDAIVCNPPYVRHHDAKQPAELFARLSAEFGVRLSRLTNVYCLFLLRIAALLSERGRAAVITPAEFLNADFGAAVKQSLLRSGRLRGFVVFHPASSVFDGVLTTAAVTLLEAGGTRGSVRFVEIERIDQLEAALFEASDERARLPQGPGQACPGLSRASRTQEKERGAGASACDAQAGAIEWRVDRLEAGRKWSHFGRADSQHLGASPLRPLGDYATCMRGIATGANCFFTLSRADARRWDIPADLLRPCITKALDAPGSVFTKEHLQALESAGRRMLVLDATEADESRLSRYLAHGRAAGIHRRYLPRHRRPWFSTERREPADLWAATFGRGRLRFVRNVAGVLNLTAFHGVYLRPMSRRLIEPLLAWFHSAAFDRLRAAEQRVYGDGLLKLEPRDVERLPTPDFDALGSRFEASASSAGAALLGCRARAIAPSLQQRINALFKPLTG